MELELDRTHLSGYETVLDTTIFHEETMEMIVPDACPDILRIADTEARVLLGGKEAMEGRAEVSGTVKASILYLPDGEEGMRRMEVAIPFSCSADAPGLGSHCTLVALPRVQAAETRSLNPRKVLVRVNLAVCLSAYAPMTDSICAGVLGPEGSGVEQLQEDHSAYVVACVQEKPFTFSDDVAISGSRPEAAQLLKNRVTLACNESKVIGNKLIFKGEARLQLFYRAGDNSLCTADYELPFSQIMEITGAGEDADCTLDVVLTSAECNLDSAGEGRTVAVSLGLLAQAVVREERSFQMLTDLYSTLYSLTPETEAYSFCRVLDQGIRSQTVREILETGVMARAVADAYVCIGQVTQGRDGEKLVLTADAAVTVVFTGEEGGVSSVTRSIPVSCPVELPEGCLCTCTCTCPEPVFATTTTGGIEVRFPLDFRFLALSVGRVAGVSAVRVEEAAAGSGENQPSIVLRMVGRQERLWDIAKAYRTTAEEIRRANGLEEEGAPQGQLLLIPRKR